MTSPLPNSQKEWRVPSHLHLAIHDGDMHVWCHFPRTKQLPIGKYLQTTPFREIICKKTPMDQFALLSRYTIFVLFLHGVKKKCPFEMHEDSLHGCWVPNPRENRVLRHGSAISIMHFSFKE